MSIKNISIRGVFVFILLCLIWGYNWVVMKQAVPATGPVQFAMIRTAVGALVLFVFAALLRKPICPQAIPWMVLLGLTQTTGFTSFSVLALLQGGAGKTSVLTFIMPFWVMMLSWPILGERVRGWQWLPVLCAMLGLVCILDPFHLHANLLSMLFAVFGGISWACSVIVAKQIQKRHVGLDLLSVTAWQMLFGAIPILVLGLFFPAQPIHWTLNYAAQMIFSVVFANALGWLMWLYVLQKVSANLASMSMLIVPVVAMLSAWIQLGERPVGQEMTGMVLILFSLVMVSVMKVAKPDIKQ